MLEEIALKYVNQTETDLRSISYGLVILGAIIAGLVTSSKSELTRAPYFAFSALLLLVGAASQFVWLDSVGAMTGGYLWALMAVDVIGGLVIGFFFGVIAMARSRDAFGHGRYAALAFIPLANLVLLLKDSKAAGSAHRIPTIPLLTGGLGVLSGFVMLAAGIGLSATLRVQTERMIAQANMDPASEAAGVEFMIRSQGLEATLAQMAAEVAVPQEIDEITTLFEIQTDATTLRYRYTINAQADNLPDTFRRRLTQDLCANDGMRPVLLAGGAIEQAYYGMDGRGIGTVRITRESCSP